MTNHLSEDELILHYYGEVDRADAARVASHLESCAACQASREQLARVMAMVDTAAPVEAPEGFERIAWARLEPRLDANRGGGWRVFFGFPQWAMAGGVAALVLAAFVAGRFTVGTPVSVTPGVASRKRESVSRVALAASSSWSGAPVAIERFVSRNDRMSIAVSWAPAGRGAATASSATKMHICRAATHGSWEVMTTFIAATTNPAPDRR
jgi:anti-sigma factor RsiW